MTNPKELERLRKSRTELTQSELAKKLGMSTSTYRRMLEGSTPITMDTIQRIAVFFKIPEETLISNTILLEHDKPSNKELWLTVRLDGSKKTLEYWLERLKKINETL